MSRVALRRKLLRLLVVVVGLVVALTVAVLLYLRFGDLGRHCRTVERVASEALGRELTIDGGFEASIGLTSSLLARDVRLANAPWGTEPAMVTVDEVSLRLRPLSLLFPPVRVERVEVAGARVLVETGPDGESNWDLGGGNSVGGGGPPPAIVLGAAVLRDVELIVRNGSAADHRLAVTRGDLASAPDDMLALGLEASLDGLPLELDGHVGPLEGLIQGAELAADLRGRLGPAEFEANGRIPDLATLAGADAEIRVHGDDLATLTDALGLPSLGAGAIAATLRLRPAEAGSEVVLDAQLGDLHAAIEGRFDALLEPRDVALELDASGPDAAAAAFLAGIEGLPAEPFELTGSIHWQGFPVTVRDLRLSLGADRLEADGVLGAPPRLHGSDLVVDASGPDAGWIAAIAGIGLPSGSYRAQGRLRRVEGGIAIDDLEVKLGANKLAVTGTLGDPPSLAGSDLRVGLVGPDLSVLGAVVGIELPAEHFTVRARLVEASGAVELDGVEARVGGNRATVHGRVGTGDRLAGTDLRVDIHGPDLSRLGRLVAMELPDAGYAVSGRVRIVRGGYRLEGVTAEVGDLRAQADGLVVAGPGLIGSDLRLQLGGSDLSWPAAAAGFTGVPELPFRIEGGVAVSRGGYRLEAVAARLGDVDLEAEGRLGPWPSLAGSDLRVAVSAPGVGTVQAILGDRPLPDRPFAVSGAVRGEAEAVELAGVVVELGGVRLAVDGILVPKSGLAGSSADLELSGQDLDELARILTASGLGELPELPHQTFTVGGRLRLDARGVDLEHVRARSGLGTVVADGRLTRAAGLVGSELTVDVDGPDASAISAVLGFEVPMAPFELAGRVQRLDSGVRFDRVVARLGGYRAHVDGFLGEAPAFVGSDLTVRASGPGLAPLGAYLGWKGMPEGPFAVEARLDGTPERLAVQGLRARWGASDLAGSLRLMLEGRPAIRADLVSDTVDLTPILARRAQAAPDDAVTAQTRHAGARLIPDTPLALDALSHADLDLDWRVGHLVVPGSAFQDLEVALDLEDGALRVERFGATGDRGGRLEADLTLEPMAGGHRVGAHLRVDNAPFNLSRRDIDPEGWSSLSVDLELEGEGRSLRELASTSTGGVVLVLGGGQIDNRLVDLIAADIALEVLTALNPFAAEEPESRLECGVAVIHIAGGTAVLDTLAVRTDKMTIIGSGSLDLATEELDLRWVTKPRKGLGLSASALTNPYIKLGGTLSEPALEMKPLEALTATGAAVATAGLSLLGKGLWDRVTSGRKVCERAVERAQAERSRPAGGRAR